MLSRVIAKNVGDVFFETQCSSNITVTSDWRTSPFITERCILCLLQLEATFVGRTSLLHMQTAVSPTATVNERCTGYPASAILY